MLKNRKPTFPGEVLYEDVMKPLGMTITQGANILGISRKTLSEIINGRCSITPETALRIGKATGTTAESWLSMQLKYDLWKAMKSQPKNVVKLAMSA